jgi:hypothetical protein
LTMQADGSHPRCHCCGCPHELKRGAQCYLQQVPRSDNQRQYGDVMRLDTYKLARFPDPSLVDMIIKNCEMYGCMSTAPQNVRDNVRSRLEEFRTKFAENKKIWDQKRESGGGSNHRENNSSNSAPQHQREHNSRNSSRSMDTYSAPENRTSSAGGGVPSSQSN